MSSLYNKCFNWLDSHLAVKIFLDRYSAKDVRRDKPNPEVGSTILFRPNDKIKEVGFIKEYSGDLASVSTYGDDPKTYMVPISDIDVPLETPEDMWNRVAKAVASVESQDERSYFEEKFLSILRDWKFLPGGRILAGAGLPGVTLANCFVIKSPEDSRQGIFDSLSEMAELMARGGGVGVNISTLRPKYAYVEGVNGRSSGAVSWAEMFSQTTGLIEQGGSRRGALLLLMEDWHPDVLEFINVKRNMSKITNANISVDISDEFMAAVKRDDNWDLYFPDTKHPEYKNYKGDIKQWKALGYPVVVYKTVKARDMWNSIIESAHASAEPGVLFRGTIDRDSNSSYYDRGRLICTNPCQPGFATVMTPEGVVTFDDIEAGSTIWTGKEWTVVEDKWETGVKPVYQYTTAAGSFRRFIGTENHRVLCGGKKVEVKDAEFLTISSIYSEFYGEKIVKREFLGEFPVYDIRVAHPDHVYWTGGVIVSNCGEQNLPEGGVCNLGHINLAKFDNIRDIQDVTNIATRFLDNVVTLSKYFLPHIEEQQLYERRVGLGTLGLAEHLINKKLTYGSDECVKYLDTLYREIARESYLTSMDLGLDKGSFEGYSPEKVSRQSFLGRMSKMLGLEKAPEHMRNVCLLTQAPTGTVGTMVGTSTGIEPFFMFEWQRNSRLGSHVEYVKCYKNWKDENPNAKIPEYFVNAMMLSPKDHIKVQAVIQKWTDSSISKTCNVPEDWTVEQVKELYEYMYDSGCKGGTIYRDNSRSEQVLESVKSDKPEEKAEIKPEPTQKKTKVGNVHHGSTISLKTNLGTAHLTLNKTENGIPIEMFVTVGKAGSDVQSLAEGMGRLVSLCLQNGVSPEAIVSQLSGIGGSRSVGFGPNKIASLPDAISKAIEKIWFEELIDKSNLDICPDCGDQELVSQGGCESCRSCGYSAC